MKKQTTPTAQEQARKIYNIDGVLYLKGGYSDENNAFEYFNMTDEMEKGQSWSRYDLNGYELQEASTEEQAKVNSFLDNLAKPAQEQAPEGMGGHLPKEIGLNWPVLNDGTTCMVIDDEDSGEIMVRLEETKDEAEKEFEQAFLTELITRYNNYPSLLQENQQQAKDIEELREVLKNSVSEMQNYDELIEQNTSDEVEYYVAWENAIQKATELLNRI